MDNTDRGIVVDSDKMFGVQMDNTDRGIVVDSDKMFGVQWAPKYVGSYTMGEEYPFRIPLTYKPNWFHRTMMRLCFGWKWTDD